MSEFDEWFPRHSLTGSGVQLYSKSDLETVWQACQATSAARIAELEAALENVSEDCCIKRKRITELESDARIMAEIAYKARKSQDIVQYRKALDTIAAKYREGK